MRKAKKNIEMFPNAFVITYRNTFFIWTGTFRSGDGDPPGDSFSDSWTRMRAKAKSSSFIVIAFGSIYREFKHLFTNSPSNLLH